MEIEYGKDGIPAAVLDLTSGEIFSFDGRTSPSRRMPVPDVISGPTARMFAYLGGEQHQKGWNKGAGTLPDNANLAQCGVLGVNERRPKLPLVTPLLPNGMRCVVTADGGRVGRNSQVFMLYGTEESGLELYSVKNRRNAILRVLQSPDEVRARFSRMHKLTSYQPSDTDDGRLVLRKLMVTLYGEPLSKINKLSHYRILDLLFWGQLYRPGASKRATLWERCLGLATGVDGVLYHDRCGILYEPVNLQVPLKAQFRWATFVTDPRLGSVPGSLLLTSWQGRPALVGRYRLRTGLRGDRRFFVHITGADAARMAATGQLTPELVETLLPSQPRSTITNTEEE